MTREKPHYLRAFLPTLNYLIISNSQHKHYAMVAHMKVFLLKHFYDSFLCVKNMKLRRCKIMGTHSNKWPIRPPGCWNSTYLGRRNHSQETPHFRYILVFFRTRHADVDTGKETERNKVSWEKASETCQEVHCGLPVMWSKEELQFLLAFLKVSFHIKFMEGIFVEHPLRVSYMASSFF